MYLQYGTYQHDTNDASVIITKNAQFTPDHGLRSILERWDISGELHGANTAALTTAIDALETAYATHGYDLALYEDDGTVTAHEIDSSATNSGTKIVQPPSYPEGRGAEYATMRRYAITVEAEHPVTAGAIISYAEAISVQGTGGQSWGYLVPLTGPPQAQTFTQASLVLITQEGYAVAMGAYPLPNSPVMPSAELVQNRMIRREYPQRNTQERITRWSYTFQTTAAPILTPRIR